MIYLFRKILASNLVWALARDNKHGKDIKKDGILYMERKTLFRWGTTEYRLHRIHRPDTGRDPHDHPFTFVTYPLNGSYVETVCTEDNPVQKPRQILAGKQSVFPDGMYHIINWLFTEDPYLVTFVIADWVPGRSWGFLTDEGHVDFRNYSNRGTH